MTLLLHEWKRGLKTLLIWTVAISAFMMICVFLFPEMKGMMGDVGDIFSGMGAFTRAFGMDRLDLAPSAVITESSAAMSSASAVRFLQPFWGSACSPRKRETIRRSFCLRIP